MRTTDHAIISAILAAIAYSVTGFVDVSILVFLSGILIDADHLLDYILYLVNSRKKEFKLDEFLGGRYFKRSNRTYVLLHSYELVAIIGLASVILSNPIFLWVAFSMFVHILVDQLYYPVHSFSYFLIFRAFKQFRTNELCLDG